MPLILLASAIQHQRYRWCPVFAVLRKAGARTLAPEARNSLPAASPPALARCARTGHPLLWWHQTMRSKGMPPAQNPAL